ncbi:MAG: hypothetical protein AAF787_25130 [Chloroflexota bacterium]
MMKKLFVTLMLLSVTAVASAQGFGNPLTFCGDLAEADCTLYTDATYADSATVAGLGEVVVAIDGEEIITELALDGSYTLDPELLESVMGFYGDTTDFTTMMQMIYGDIDVMEGLLMDSFNVADAQLTLSISLPQELTGGFVPTPLPIDLWYTDGQAYVDLAAFGFADPSLAEAGVWGLDIAGLYAMLFDMLENDPQTAEVMEQLSEALTDEAVTDTMMGAGDIQAFTAEFATIERIEDEARDGQTLAVFATTIDYGALFGSDTMAAMMQAQFDAQIGMMESMGGEEMSDEEMQEMMAMQEAMTDDILALYGRIFEDATYTTFVVIGEDDGLVYAAETEFSMSVNALEIQREFDATMAELSGTEATELSAEDLGFEFIDLYIGYGVDLDNLNDVSAESVLPPEGAQLFPLETLLPDMGGATF